MRNETQTILQRRHVRNNGVLLCAVLAFLSAMVVFGFFTIRGGGFFLISEDFDTQSIPFAAAMWNALRQGNGGTWCWNLDLGSSYVTGFGFYNLASPFFLITLPFPKTAYPYLAGFLFVIKYVTAATGAYLYLYTMLCGDAEKKEDGKGMEGVSGVEWCAVAGALLYAFSGYQTTNLIFHFHDMVALFPFMLWALEKTENPKMRPLFALMVCLNCLVNYMFFVQEVVFLVLYYVFRHFGEGAAVFLKRARTCLLYGMLGGGMAAACFLPNAFYILGNDRGTVAFSGKPFLPDFGSVLFLLKGMLMPGDTMSAQSAIFALNYQSTSCYLPFFGLSLVCAYLYKKRDWLAKFVLFLLVLSFSPLLQSVFLLFTASNQRWWFMPVLMMALATARVLREPSAFPVFPAAALYTAAVGLFYLFIRYAPLREGGESLIVSEIHFTQIFLIALAGGLLLCVLFRSGKAMPVKALLFTTALFCSGTTALTLYWYSNAKEDVAAYKKQYLLSSQLQPLNEQYRYALPDNIKTLVGNAGSYGTFSSTIENASRRFDTYMDVRTDFSSQYRMHVAGIGQLLGGKYFVTEDPGAAGIVDRVSRGSDTWYVTEADAFPIGFPVDYYLLTDELKALPKEHRVLALMRAAVIDAQDEERIRAVAEHADTARIDFTYPTDALLQKAVKQAVSDFSRDSRGFSCTSAYERERLVYFSVPYSTGWTARIDGEQAEIIDSGGMMALCVPPGERQIVFSYRTPWLTEGILLSAASLLLFFGLLYHRIKQSSCKNES